MNSRTQHPIGPSPKRYARQVARARTWFSTILSVCLLTSCASVDLWRRSHAYERKLYVANSRIPHLTKTEWEEIKAQFASRTECFFLDSTRERIDLVEVSLALKSDRYKGVMLRFEKIGDRWVENTAKAEPVEYLIPFERKNRTSGSETSS